MRWMILLLPLLTWALEVGGHVGALKLEDQFGNKQTLSAQQCRVITWDRATTRTANLFFEAHPLWLKSGKTAMVVDVSQTPSGIMSLFVLPRMRSYSHPILLSYDEVYNRNLPYEEGKVTVLSVVDGVVAFIGFAADEAQIEALLEHIFQ